ncbi:hypothetical protein KKA17_05080 [bacterium]|nr:hypothetical protein [bacterium]
MKVTKVNEETGEEEEVEEEKSTMVSKKISKEVQVDENRLLEIVGAPANFTESLEKLLAKKENFSLIVGPDLYTHPNAKNLARLVALVEKYSAFKLVMIPSLSNTLGVSLICELDDAKGSYTIGYNTKGDFTLSALGNGDLDMPAMNQQEGTLTSIDKRVNPTNAALPYKGYVLNDIAKALGLASKFTVDYTQKLPTCKGFKAQLFDNLPNRYENDGTEVRGYVLDSMDVKTFSDEDVAPLSEAKLEGSIIYLANPVRQFSEFTNKATNLKEEAGVYMSASFLESSDFNEGDMVKVKTGSGEVTAKIISDNKIEGEIATLPTFDSNLNSQSLFSGYRFTLATIQGV